MTWSEILIPSVASLAGALIGGAIAGYCSIRAVKTAHQIVKRVQEENQENIIQRLLQAIHEEIETIWELYMGDMGPQVESLADNHPLNLYYPIVQDYFTVYNTNAILITQIPDKDLRKAIISTYAKARSLIDSFRLNNDYLQKNEYWYRIYMQMGKPGSLEFNVNSSYQLLTNYAQVIKRVHNQTKLCVLDLLIKLKEKVFLANVN